LGTSRSLLILGPTKEKAILSFMTGKIEEKKSGEHKYQRREKKEGEMSGNKMQDKKKGDIQGGRLSKRNDIDGE